MRIVGGVRIVVVSAKTSSTFGRFGMVVRVTCNHLKQD